MLALELFQAVAHALQKEIVGGEDGAIGLELDHRHGLLDGVDEAGVEGRRLFAGGDVGGQLDDLLDLAIRVQDRVVGGLEPDLPPALAQAQEFRGEKLALA